MFVLGQSAPACGGVRQLTLTITLSAVPRHRNTAVRASLIVIAAGLAGDALSLSAGCCTVVVGTDTQGVDGDSHEAGGAAQGSAVLGMGGAVTNGITPSRLKRIVRRWAITVLKSGSCYSRSIRGLNLHPRTVVIRLSVSGSHSCCLKKAHEAIRR